MKTISTVEAARLLGISRVRVWQLVRKKRIPARRLGRDWRIRREDLERFMRDRGRFVKDIRGS